MRIGIVNDLKTAIEALRRIVTCSQEHQIAWVAYDGVEAVKKCEEDTPDIVLMDIIMPVMGGVEATKFIMKNTPCAILVVTSTISGNMSKVFEAMGYGALDVVRTPTINPQLPFMGGEELLQKIDRIGKLINKSTKWSEEALKKEGTAQETQKLPPLVIIGASTGGPSALAKVLSFFPKNLPFATIIIQHVDEVFAQGLAKWLGQQTKLDVRIAPEISFPVVGSILLAGKNDHLIMTDNLSLKYTEHPLNNPYRPSVDEFFASVAKNWPAKAVGVLLTGMGNDGAVGLKALKDCGWQTIVQREDTCIAYGMPKSAIELGAATKVLPLDDIGYSIVEMFKSQGKI